MILYRSSPNCGDHFAPNRYLNKKYNKKRLIYDKQYKKSFLLFNQELLLLKKFKLDLDISNKNKQIPRLH